MKKTPLPALLLVLIAFTPLRAQMETNANAPMNEGNPPPSGERHGPMAQLSDAERAQVKAAHDKAIEQDPSLQQKMKEAHDAMEAARKGMNEAMVHEQVKNDPAVATAHEAMKRATTPEARQKAEKALQSASRDAMVKADPSIGPILDKLHPKAGEQPNATPAAQ